VWVEGRWCSVGRWCLGGLRWSCWGGGHWRCVVAVLSQVVMGGFWFFFDGGVLLLGGVCWVFCWVGGWSCGVCGCVTT